MLKKEGMGDKDANDPMAKEMCTKNCIKMGCKYVLYDSAAKKIYQPDDPENETPFGLKVFLSVIGALVLTFIVLHLTGHGFESHHH
jgi:hypothetical protein